MAGYGSYQGSGGYESAYARNVGGATSAQRQSAFDPSRHGYGSYVDGSAEAFASGQRASRDVGSSRVSQDGLDSMSYLKDTAAIVKAMHDNARAWGSHYDTLETNRQAREEALARAAREQEEYDYKKTQRGVAERKSKAEATRAEHEATAAGNKIVYDKDLHKAALAESAKKIEELTERINSSKSATERAKAEEERKKALHTYNLIKSKAEATDAENAVRRNEERHASDLKVNEANIERIKQDVEESKARVLNATSAEERAKALHTYNLQKAELDVQTAQTALDNATTAEARQSAIHDLEVAKLQAEIAKTYAGENLTKQQTTLLEKQVEAQQMENDEHSKALKARQEQEDAVLGAGTVNLLRTWVESDQGRRKDSDKFQVAADKWLEQRGVKRQEGSEIKINRIPASKDNHGVDQYVVEYVDENGEPQSFELDSPAAMDVLVKRYGLTQFQSAIPYDYEKQIEIQAKDRTNRGTNGGDEEGFKTLAKAIDMYAERIKSTESRFSNMVPSDPGYDKTKSELDSLYKSRQQLEDLYISRTNKAFGLGGEDLPAPKPAVRKPTPTQAGNANAAVYRPSGN